jgi:tricorn protease
MISDHFREIGDCVVSIAGVRLGPETPPEYALLNRPGDVVEIEVECGGEVKKYLVKTVRDEKYLVYRHWVEKNRCHVHEKTGGAVGYVHIPDMGPAGYAVFFKSLTSEGDKEAFVVDIRYNRGGHTSGMLILRAVTGVFAKFVTRHFKPYPYLESSPAEGLLICVLRIPGSGDKPV